MNENRVILDLCGGSGAWSKPYRDAGYDVHVITLPNYDINCTSFCPEYMSFGNPMYMIGERITVRYSEVYGILAAPPCTEFSIAKNGKHRNRDLFEGMETVEACVKIIWKIRKHTRLKFWALENPRGLLRQFFGKPAYTFEQWQFGEGRVKPTDIWGYFNKPRPTVKNRPDGIVERNPDGQLRSRDWGIIGNHPEHEEYLNQFTNYDERRAAARAITPAGFAEAFFKANR